MKMTIELIALFTIATCLSQSVASNQSTVVVQKDTSAPRVVFFDDFDNNKNNWTVGDN